MQVDRYKIALMLWVEELLFIFVVGLEEERELVIFFFVLCFMSW